METVVERGEATKTVKGIPYKEIKDLTGIEHKVVDFDKYDYPTEGTMMFECTKRGDRVVDGHSYQIGATRDQGTGIFFGIVTDISTTSKKIVWRPIQVKSIMTLDLSIPEQRQIAICLQRSEICEGSPNLSKNMKLWILRVHDSEKEAFVNIQKAREAHRALNIAFGLRGEDLNDIGRDLGIMPETASLYQLTERVYKIAKDNPSEFLTIYENPNRGRVTILNRAKDTGVITHDTLGGYLYNGRPLGQTIPEVVDYLNKYPDVATTIDSLSRKKLSQSEQAMAKQDLKLDNRDAEMAALKRELQDVKNQLNDKTAAEISNEDPDLVAELEKVKEEALSVGITYSHLSKPTRQSIDKLKKAIAEKKSS